MVVINAAKSPPVHDSAVAIKTPALRHDAIRLAARLH
jgi:hypothetical protein